jgi:cytosol alanyl aminopeptidase
VRRGFRPFLLVFAASFALSLAAATPEPPVLRLPGETVPKGARLDLTIRPSDPAYTGEAAFEVELKESLDLIWINARGLTISKASVTTAGQERTARVVPGGDEFQGLALDAPVGPGAAILRLSFSGTAAENDTRGLFRQKDGESWYVYSQFEPVDARRAFPCFDEPSFKHPWTLTLHVPKGDVAVSNTAQSGEKDEAGGMKAVSFETTKPLPSYLVALGVGPFDVVDAGKVGPTPLRVIVPKGKAGQARLAIETIGPLLNILQDYFGIPYPYGKLDSVAIPRTVGFGAMENPGLITYSSSLILARPEDEGIGFRRDLASVAAHEMAHQWFGDLVTMAFWDDVWLNESFASWMGDKTLSRFRPDWHTLADRVGKRNSAMGADSLVTARKIRQPITSKDDIANAFDGITYAKGQSVLNMFEAWMGPAAFQKGVRSYLKAHADGNATAHDFLAALGAEGHPEVSAAFSTFLDQPGVPEVSISLACASGKPAVLSLAQKRLLPLGSSAAVAETWQVPFCVRYGQGGSQARECRLVTSARAELPLGQAEGCPAWVLANDGAVGYYRASYQGDLLKKLLQAAPKHLDAAEKLGVISDTNALASAGEIPPGEALGLIPALAAEDDRHIVNALADVAEGVKQRGLAEELFPAFGRFVAKTFGARARSLGLSPKPGEAEDVRILRASMTRLVAIEGKDPDLRRKALALSRQWLKDRTALGPDMRETVLAIAADAGDAPLFDGYLAAARKEEDRRTKTQILEVLGIFKDPALQERAFRVALAPEFDARDTGGIFWAALSDVRSRQAAWDFLKGHWDELIARLPEQSRTYLPFMASSFCDDAHRIDAEAFLTSRLKGVEGAPRNLAQTLERIRVCTAIRTAHAPGLKEFLSRY